MQVVHKTFRLSPLEAKKLERARRKEKRSENEIIRELIAVNL